MELLSGFLCLLESPSSRYRETKITGYRVLARKSLAHQGGPSVLGSCMHGAYTTCNRRNCGQQGAPLCWAWSSAAASSQGPLRCVTPWAEQHCCAPRREGPVSSAPLSCFFLLSLGNTMARKSLAHQGSPYCPFQSRLLSLLFRSLNNISTFNPPVPRGWATEWLHGVACSSVALQLENPSQLYLECGAM